MVSSPYLVRGESSIYASFENNQGTEAGLNEDGTDVGRNPFLLTGALNLLLSCLWRGDTLRSMGLNSSETDGEQQENSVLELQVPAGKHGGSWF